MSKCPHCGAEIKFDAKSKMVLCEYCGSSFNPQELKKDAKKAKKNNTLEGKAFSCTQCGATLLTFDETAITFCSYCGSQNMIEEKMITQTCPDLIIPFTKTKEECINNYKRKIASFIFCPNYMKSDLIIQKFRGIYMPYGIYNLVHSGECINKGKKYSHRAGDYVYYDDYSIYADVDAKYEGISFDLLSKFYDEYSMSIPFNYKEAIEFNTNYLPGFYADSKDVEIDTYAADAIQIGNNDSTRFLKTNSIYSKYSCYNPTVPFKINEKKVGMFPVYFLATRDKDNKHIHYAVINGQTGKVAVDMPIDYTKFLIFSIILAIPIYFILNTMPIILPYIVTIFSIICSVLGIIFCNNQISKCNKKENHYNDKGFTNADKKTEKKYRLKLSYTLMYILSIIISIAVLVINPVSDIYYYGCSAISLIFVLLSFKYLVNIYNISVSRLIPQLEKRGGDENG